MSEPKYITKHRELEKRRQEELVQAKKNREMQLDAMQREERKTYRSGIGLWVNSLLQAKAVFCENIGYSFYLVDHQGERILPFPCEPIYWPSVGYGNPNYYSIVIRNPMHVMNDIGISLRNPADVVKLYDEYSPKFKHVLSEKQ